MRLYERVNVCLIVIVSDPPRVSLSLGANQAEGEIEEGKDVVLDCKVVSNPYSSHIGWLFQGNEQSSYPIT